MTENTNNSMNAHYYYCIQSYHKDIISIYNFIIQFNVYECDIHLEECAWCQITFFKTALEYHQEWHYNNIIMANNATNYPQSCVMILLLVCTRINTLNVCYFDILVHLFQDGLDYLVGTDFQNRYSNLVIEIDILIWLMSVFK